MRERLIELIQKAVDGCARHWAEVIADYLLANGVIAPPCNIGDKVYMLVTKRTHSYEFSNGKMLRKDNQHTFIKESRLVESNFFRVIKDFGKTVFLTREEAERAMKDGKDANVLANEWSKT